MAAQGLSILRQDDFSAGAFPSEDRDLVPANGVTDAVNCLISDDGLLYRRGGSALKSSADLHELGSGAQPIAGARFLWDGFMAGGQRTLILGRKNLSVLAANDTDLVYLLDASPSDVLYPTKIGTVSGLVALPRIGKVYGGSRMLSTYSAGTATVTNGSAAVVGAGTAWLANADIGRIFSVTSSRPYVVTAVADDTHLTLDRPFVEATAAGIAYELGAFANIGRVADIYLGIARRLLACVGNRVYESEIGHPTVFVDDEFQELPGGVSILGAEAVRDIVVLFTTAGVWALSNVAYEITDASGNAQQRLEQVNRDLILWSWAGVATYGGQLVVPAVDGVWLFDPISAPQNITGGMTNLYRSYVDAGHHTGIAAVINGHYVLPILNSSEAVVDTLVCRLRPTRRANTIGWTRLSGDGANMTAYAVRVASATARQPYLLGGHQSSGRVCTLPYFTTTAATASDANATAHVAEIITREYRLPNGIKNLLKKIRARFELTDPSTVNPTLGAEYAEADGSYTTISGSAPEGAVTAPYTWTVNRSGFGMHFRIRTANAVAKFFLHSLDVFFRPSGKQ